MAADHIRQTQAKVNVSDDSAAVTLMSTDVEKIRSGMLMIQ